PNKYQPFGAPWVATIMTLSLSINPLDTPFANNSLTVQSKPTFWTETESDYWIDKLKETDILIISTPMINFNYSGTLKNFIDSICVADKSFTYKYVT
ncbi:NAD(P)H-dependent oxidoreductase, partial [Mycoplasmopsis bovis]|uniref:NAD(P)H-dependent oxidoreductase n=1 Tax=Mycoplasmopsis bovis TaxID=28903 RepID=UPI003D2CE412